MTSQPSCYTLNFIQSQDVTNNLDSYVVLTFVLTLLLSILIVLLLVKYITYNMQLDVERQKNITHRKVLPVRIDEEFSESDEDDEAFEWPTIVNGNEEERDIEGACSVESTLQTNYVEAEQVCLDDKEEVSESKVTDLDVAWLISSLNLPHIFISSQHPFEMTQLFSNEQQVLHISNLVCYEQLLHQLAIIRKVGSLQMINFTIDVLLHQRVLHQELSLKMRAKYEQLFDSFDCSKTESVFFMSKQITLIIQHFIKDLQQLLVKRDALEELVSLLFSHPLNCLKIFLLAIPDHSRLMDETTISTVVFVEKLLFMIKGRYSFFKKAINDVSKPRNEVFVSFDQNMNTIFQFFQRELRDILRGKTSQMNSQQLEMKLEQNINISKMDLLNSSGDLSKKLTNFSESLMGLLISHLESHTVFVNQLNEHRMNKMKDSLTNLQQQTMNEMQEIEEQCLNSLQEQSDFSDAQIEEVVNQTGNLLKEFKKDYNTLVKTTEKLFIARQLEATKFTHFCIDYFVKLISSRYRTVLSANISFIQSFPSLSDRVQSKLETSIRGKMSMISFDVVLGMVKYMLMEMENVKYNFVLQMPCFYFGGLSNETDFMKSSVLKHFESDFEIPDTLLDILHERCHSMINKAFQHLQCHLQQVVQQEVVKSTKSIFNENQIIFQTFREKMRVPRESKKKNSQYLSRKGSSFKEKPMGGKLLDLYHGLIQVREHRYQEKVQQIEIEHNQNKKKNGRKCMRYLDQQQELLQRKEIEKQKFFAFFQLNQYYMREMLLKKMNAIEDKTTDNETIHENEQKSSVNKKTKSPKKLSGKISKRRKSRRVSDVT